MNYQESVQREQALQSVPPPPPVLPQGVQVANQQQQQQSNLLSQAVNLSGIPLVSPLAPVRSSPALPQQHAAAPVMLQQQQQQQQQPAFPTQSPGWALAPPVMPGPVHMPMTYINQVQNQAAVTVQSTEHRQQQQHQILPTPGSSIAAESLGYYTSCQK